MGKKKTAVEVYLSTVFKWDLSYWYVHVCVQRLCLQ